MEGLLYADVDTEIAEGTDDSIVPSGRTSEAFQSGRMKKVGAIVLAGAVLLLAPMATRLFGSHAPLQAAQTEAEQKDQIIVTRPRDECSKAGDNCLFTQCCQVSGHKCFESKPGHAFCNETCTVGPQGSICALVSDSSRLAPVVYAPGTSMYCFMVHATPPKNMKKSHELALMKTQLKFGAGIFGCSGWDIFSDVKMQLSPGPPKPLYTHKVLDTTHEFHLLKRKETGGWVNTPLFYQVWLKIRDVGRWQQNDYVIKADADAVLLPQRLVAYLKDKKVTEHGVYYENCKNVDSGYFGNLEVMSNKAAAVYINNIELCYKTLCWKAGKAGGCSDDWKYGPWGEDLFAQRCMDKHGVEKVEAFNLTTDGACPADRPEDQKENKKWQPNCANTLTPAMHPFKTPKAWFACLGSIMQKTYQ